MAAIEDLSAWYDVGPDGDAETCTVQGVEVAALFDAATEVLQGDMLVVAPTLRLPSSAVSAVEGGACVIRGASYVIRNVLRLPPDGRELRLVLAAT